MFVISLVCDGKLKTTSIKLNANDAVEVANQWYEENKEICSKESYIAIDQKSRDLAENVRFAEIRFDQDPGELRLFIKDRREKAIFTSKYAQVTKQFIVSFLEFALVRITEYLKEKNNPGKK